VEDSSSGVAVATLLVTSAPNGPGHHRNPWLNAGRPGSRASDPQSMIVADSQKPVRIPFEG